MNLSSELIWLCFITLFTSIMWIPYIINRMYEMGAWPALYNPQPDIRPKAQWAMRMMRAHENAIENLVIFAPLVILIEITGSHSTITEFAVVLYFYARLVHFCAFTFAIPLIRVPAFLTGFSVQVILGLSLLKLT
ncbi:MAG: MAPEG family protein [endosymbiont of Galathealinum brachiosum]|uniref:MAPEG family protein n=1 Tax=endosymbiont of Galathealinum brachiosum TaxID=2200906 RepID=A0A370DDM7_9GAMM|nr:MAG: MAPEG family protein [endosymbiont of Galathealinum brachiosum]